jgi:hypothetical protein
VYLLPSILVVAAALYCSPLVARPWLSTHSTDSQSGYHEMKGPDAILMTAANVVASSGLWRNYGSSAGNVATHTAWEECGCLPPTGAPIM